MHKIEMRILALVILSLQLHLPVMVVAQENFYAGKTIRVIVGTSAGGGFDTYTRTIARHFGKHIPGQPSIQVENMAGAGHLIAANHMYKVAKPDGLTIGHFHGGWFLTNYSNGRASNLMLSRLSF
jgi:tripartite-type tricarboxylate transporter receptor subunit TctC